MNIDIEMKLIKQTFHTREIGNIKEKIQGEIKKINFCKKIKPGMKIGITAGSRGIDRINEIINIISNEVKKCGGCPIVIASMGSHGGATKQGQLEILRHYGITEEELGVPVQASDRAFVLGKLDNGLKIYVNDLVKILDGLIIINRIKVHTSFKADIESGLNKMVAVGLGHHDGASLIHSLGVQNLYKNILQFAEEIIMKLPIIGGIGILENSYDRIMEIHAVEPNDFQKIDKQLLIKCKNILPRLPVNQLDLLIIGEIGKNISGTGMDSNIVGGIPRISIQKNSKFKIPQIEQIVALDLSNKSQGNAHGIGLATAITKKLYNKIDFKSTYINSITSGFLSKSRIPMVFASDEEAISTCLKVLDYSRRKDPKIIMIKNTLKLDKMYVSKRIWHRIRSNKAIVSESKKYFEKLAFNNQGELKLNLDK